MPLSDIVAVTISTETAGLTQQGFGTPLILSPRPSWVERVRSYTDLAGMVADGFTALTPEYLAAAVIFSQSPRVETVKVGRCANKPTQRWAITPVATNSATYRLKSNGTVLSFTADSSALIAEVIAGLKALIDAQSLAVTVSDETTFMRIVANTAGAFFTMEVAPNDLPLMAIAQDHADPGLAADLAAIALEDDDWYGIINLYNSKACVAIVAAYAEANKKLYIAQTQDSAVITTALSGTDDVAEATKASAYARTALIYHPNNGAFADAAWAGKCLPFDPGSETWKFKTLAGIATTAFSATHLVNLRAKFCNYYYTIAGRNIAAEGQVSANEFIDVIRGRDWFEARLSERCALALMNAKKIGYTPQGVAIIEGELRAQLTDGIDVGFLTNDPAPFVSMPNPALALTADRAARILRNVKFNATIAGAIHKLVISGVIAV